MLQRVGIPALTVVSVLSCTVLSAARPAAGDAISDAKAKAAAIEAQLTQAQNEMSTLSQQYDEAQYHLTQINSSIATTKANVAADQTQVANDKATLAKAAVANYISDGTAAAQNPIFSGNEKTLGATTEYNTIAEGDISLAVDNLHSAENSLNDQVAQLQGEQSQAQTQVTAEQNAVNQNAQAVQQQKSALASENAQIASLIQQQEQAEAAAAAKAAQERQAAAAAAAAQAAAAPAPSSSGCGRSGGTGRAQPGGAAAQLPRWGRRRAGGREPDRRPLRVGRRVPQGLGQPGVRLLGPHRLVLGPGRGRPAALLGRPDVRLDPGAHQRPPAG